MTKNVISVKKNYPLYKTIEILLENRITGVPVVTDNNRIIGIISEKDLMRLLYDSKWKSIEDFMTTDVTCFDENDNLVDLVRCLIENNYRRIPITSKGKLTGIVSRTDIVRYILLKKSKEQEKSEVIKRIIQIEEENNRQRKKAW